VGSSLLDDIQQNNPPNTGIHPPVPRNNQAALWIIIMAIGLFLSFFTFRMKREIDRKQEKGQ